MLKVREVLGIKDTLCKHNQGYLNLNNYLPQIMPLFYIKNISSNIIISVKKITE